MNRQIYLFAILVLSIVSDAKKIKPLPLHPYIFNLGLQFNEDRLDEFMVDSFFATVNPDSNNILHCEVTLSDIVKSLPVKKTTTTDFISAFHKLEISISDDDVTNFASNLNYADLSSIGFSASKVYKNIAKTYFKDRPADLLASLNILGIAPEFSVAYTFGTDEELFNVFRSAKLTHDNLVAIANIINATTAVKDITSSLDLKKINQLYLSNFINTKVSPYLLEKGLTEERLLNFLRSFPMTLSNYKNSKFVKTCFSSLTKYKTVAVAVSRSEIVTNDDSLVSKYLNLEKYTTLSAEAIEDEGTGYSISADNISANKSDNIIRIKIDGTLSTFVQEATSYEGVSSAACNYITLDDDELVVQNVLANMVNDQLIVSKSYNTVFKKGSPLICGQSLYGLAALDRVTTIIFDHITEEKEEVKEAAPIPEAPEISVSIKEILESIASQIDLCKYLGCGNAKEEPVEEDESQVSEESVAKEEALEEDESHAGEESIAKEEAVAEDENQTSEESIVKEEAVAEDENQVSEESMTEEEAVVEDANEAGEDSMVNESPTETPVISNNESIETEDEAISQTNDNQEQVNTESEIQNDQNNNNVEEDTNNDENGENNNNIEEDTNNPENSEILDENDVPQNENSITDNQQVEDEHEHHNDQNSDHENRDNDSTENEHEQHADHNNGAQDTEKETVNTSEAEVETELIQNNHHNQNDEASSNEEQKVVTEADFDSQVPQGQSQEDTVEASNAVTETDRNSEDVQNQHHETSENNKGRDEEESEEQPQAHNPSVSEDNGAAEENNVTVETKADPQGQQQENTGSISEDNNDTAESYINTAAMMVTAQNEGNL